VSDSPSNDYGATLDGVQGHIPLVTIDGADAPSTADVQRFMDGITNRVAARIGPVETITDPERAGVLVAAARALVHLGAAAQTMGAANPVLASPVAGVSYADWLWKQFQAGLDELANMEAGGGNTPGPGPGDEFSEYRLPVWSFPNTVRLGKATTHWEKY
jgi:hypothetical protein